MNNDKIEYFLMSSKAGLAYKSIDLRYCFPQLYPNILPPFHSILITTRPAE